MNRKHNPYVAMLALLLLALILTFTCTGCAVEGEATEETKPTPRFTREYVDNSLTIITDTQTGVQYLVCNQYHTGIGMCKLEVE